MEANFKADKRWGRAPATIQFTDTSLGDPDTWAWNFGDGKAALTQNPSHTYTEEGCYTVILTASRGDDTNTKTRVAYISIYWFKDIEHFEKYNFTPYEITELDDYNLGLLNENFRQLRDLFHNLLTKGHCCIVTTPDGNNRYKVNIDNDGNLSTEKITEL